MKAAALTACCFSSLLGVATTLGQGVTSCGTRTVMKRPVIVYWCKDLIKKYIYLKRDKNFKIIKRKPQIFDNKQHCL